MLPEARQEGIFFEWLGQDLVVYDVAACKYHHLNPAASLVWKSCDGRRTVSELTEVLRRELTPDADEEAVQVALLLLKDANLLMPADAAADAPVGTRRDFLRKAALAGGLAVAAIHTLATPAVATHTVGCTEEDWDNGWCV